MRTHGGKSELSMSGKHAQLTRQQQSWVYSLNFVKDAISVGIVPLRLLRCRSKNSVEKLMRQPESMSYTWNGIA